MGKSGKTGFGDSSYFGLPNRKRKLLTKEFLQTFKEELIKIYNKNIDYENETYYEFYGNIESTGGFYHALKNACEKHNLTKAIYEYATNMPWYDSDLFDDNLVSEMINKGVIKKDRPKDYISDFVGEDCKAQYKLVEQYKGYNVIEYGNWFDDDREGLEYIYKDSSKELIWLN